MRDTTDADMIRKLREDSAAAYADARRCEEALHARIEGLRAADGAAKAGRYGNTYDVTGLLEPPAESAPQVRTAVRPGTNGGACQTRTAVRIHEKQSNRKDT